MRAGYTGDGLQAGLQRLGAEWETARTVREGLSDAGSVAAAVIPGTGILATAKVAVNQKLIKLLKPSIPFGSEVGAVPGRVRSRINFRIGTTQNKNPGLRSAWHKHGGSGPATKSQFTITYEKMIEILNKKSTVNSPVGIAPKSQIKVNRRKGIERSDVFVREVDAGQIVGRLAAKHGHLPTTKLTILTDRWVFPHIQPKLAMMLLTEPPWQLFSHKSFIFLRQIELT